MTWRDTAPLQTQDELDECLDLCLGTAQDRLTIGTPLLPFAVVLTRNGDWSVRASLGEGETADVLCLLSDLERGLRSDRAALRVAGVVSDVLLDGGDAIQVHLEHADPAAPPVVVALPYRRKRRGNEFGDLVAAAGDRRIWG